MAIKKFEGVINWEKYRPFYYGNADFFFPDRFINLRELVETLVESGVGVKSVTITKRKSEHDDEIVEHEIVEHEISSLGKYIIREIDHIHCHTDVGCLCFYMKCRSGYIHANWDYDAIGMNGKSEVKSKLESAYSKLNIPGVPKLK